MEGPGESRVFFQDYVDYEGGVIVMVSLSTNRIRLFSKIGKEGYSLNVFQWNLLLVKDACILLQQQIQSNFVFF